MNTVKQVFLWYDGVSFGYSGIAGSWGRLIPNFLRNCHIDFQSGCTSFNFYQKCRTVPIHYSISSPQWAVSSVFFISLWQIRFKTECSVQKVISCDNVFKAIPQFLFYQVQCMVLCWGLWYIWTWLFCTVDRHGTISVLHIHVAIQLDQNHLIELLSFFLLYNFGFFVKNQVFIAVGF